jgi:serine/threonine-protein kinase
MVVGTPAYMSPEQCRGEVIDARSDIYACGILLYQLVAGRLPFAGDNAMDLAVKHVRAEPPPIHTVLPTVNRDLERVILTSLGKWPAQRQESAKELKAQLEAVLPQLDDDGVVGRADATLPPSSGLGRRALQEHLDADSVSTLRTSPSATSDPDIAPTLTSEKAMLLSEREPIVRDRNHERDRERGRGLSPAALDATVPAGPLHFDDLAAHPARPLAPALPAQLPASISIPEPDHTLASVVAAPPAQWPPAAIAAPRPAGGTNGWLLIPLALVVGIVVGVLAYFLSK